MKNFAGRIVIFIFILVIAFLFFACDIDSSKDALDKTSWKGSLGGNNYSLTFNSPNFTIIMTSPGNTSAISGTYIISGSNVTLLASDGFYTTGTLSGKYLDFRGEDGPLFTKQ